MDDLLDNLLSTVSSSLSKNVCFTLTPFDARSELVRTKEMGLGNWIADVLLHAYAESLMESGRGGRKGAHGNKVEFTKEDSDSKGEGSQTGRADGVILCGGTLRGDSQYGPGKITLGDILGELCFCQTAKRLTYARRDTAVRRSRGLLGDRRQGDLGHVRECSFQVASTGRVSSIQHVTVC